LLLLEILFPDFIFALWREFIVGNIDFDYFFVLGPSKSKKSSSYYTALVFITAFTFFEFFFG
jgi:hypothetical protein